jgi:cell division protein FtsW (lipid II flippase)
MDWVLIAAVLALSALGVLLVWSATGTRTYLEKQAVFAVIGLIVMFAVSAVDYRLRDHMESGSEAGSGVRGMPDGGPSPGAKPAM